MHLNFGESLLVSIFCMLIVFIVLAVIYLLIRIFSVIVDNFRKDSSQAAKTQTEIKHDNPADSALATAAAKSGANAAGPEFSTGELKLKGVDEKTAAMIMAIVSDESNIPLSELRFKSIRLIQEEY